MTTTDDEQAEQPTCIHCDRRPTEPPTLLCTSCTRRLNDNLTELGRTHARLDPAPGAGGGPGGGRGTPGFGSRSPARDDVLVLTDRRRVAHDPEQPGNAAGTLPVLLFWLDTSVAEGVMPVSSAGAGSVAVAAGRLRLWSSRLSEQWWIGDMLTAVDAAVWHVRRAMNELEPTVPLGGCPVLPDDCDRLWAATWLDLPPRLGRVAREALIVERGCGGQVRARAFGQTASCPRCGCRWETLAELRQLGEWLGDALLDLPGLGRYLDVPVSTLTTWAQRDGWEKRGARGRRLYRLVDARASFARRRLVALEVVAA